MREESISSPGILIGIERRYAPGIAASEVVIQRGLYKHYEVALFSLLERDLLSLWHQEISLNENLMDARSLLIPHFDNPL